MTPEERFIADLQKYGRVVAERHALQSMSKSDDLIDRFVNGPTLFGRPIRFPDLQLETKGPIAPRMYADAVAQMRSLGDPFVNDWLDAGDAGIAELQAEAGRLGLVFVEAPDLCPTCGAYWACDC